MADVTAIFATVILLGTLLALVLLGIDTWQETGRWQPHPVPDIPGYRIIRRPYDWAAET